MKGKTEELDIRAIEETLEAEEARNEGRPRLRIIVAALLAFALVGGAIAAVLQPEGEDGGSGAATERKARAAVETEGAQPSDPSEDGAAESGDPPGAEGPPDAAGGPEAGAAPASLAEGSSEAASATSPASPLSPSAGRGASGGGSAQSPSAPAPAPEPEPSPPAQDPAPDPTPPPAPDPEPVQPEPPAKHWVHGYKCGSCDYRSTSAADMDAHQKSQMLAGADHGAYGSWSWEE